MSKLMNSARWSDVETSINLFIPVDVTDGSNSWETRPKSKRSLPLLYVGAFVSWGCRCLKSAQVLRRWKPSEQDYALGPR
jgi:hypothetical protein